MTVTSEILRKAKRALVVHSFRPKDFDSESCIICNKNWRDTGQHFLSEESHDTVKSEALKAINAALAEAESAPAKEKEGAHSNHPGKDKYHG